MDKPTETMNTTDFRPALLWVMGKIGQAHKQEVLTAFDQEFGPLIPESQRKVNEKDGKEFWRTNVSWSSADLVKAGLLKRIPGGKGIWSITDAGRELVDQQLTFQEAPQKSCGASIVHLHQRMTQGSPPHLAAACGPTSSLSPT
jgi:hypothetical protein